jgi:alpha-beta hydrolase superfamily lysophospholipase
MGLSRVTTQQLARDVQIPSADGTILHGTFWTAANPQAALVVAHGLSEHAGCYRHVAEALLAALDIAVIVPEFRGHGRSPGRRGAVRRYEDLVNDLRGALGWVEQNLPSLPTFILGHSNGGQVALRLVLEGANDLAGLILSNPALRLAMPVSRAKLLLGRVLRYCAPMVTLQGAIPGEYLTRDPEIQKQQCADPFRHSRINAPFYFGMIEGGLQILARAGEIQLPVLILLGAKDPLIDPEASRTLFQRISSIDKRLTVYPDVVHEPFNDIHRQRVIADMIGWLRARISSSEPATT